MVLSLIEIIADSVHDTGEHWTLCLKITFENKRTAVFIGGHRKVMNVSYCTTGRSVLVEGGS